MQNNSQFLFVYGSLLSGFKSPAYEYLFRYFNYVNEASVTGTIYDMGNYAVATGTDSGRIIKGELYEIKDPNELSFVLAQLDDYEGLYPDDEQEKPQYIRSLTEAKLGNGTAVQAMVYWYNGDVANQPIVNLESMMDYIRLKNS